MHRVERTLPFFLWPWTRGRGDEGPRGRGKSRFSSFYREISFINDSAFNERRALSRTNHCHSQHQRFFKSFFLRSGATSCPCVIKPVAIQLTLGLWSLSTAQRVKMAMSCEALSVMEQCFGKMEAPKARGWHLLACIAHLCCPTAWTQRKCSFSKFAPLRSFCISSLRSLD